MKQNILFGFALLLAVAISSCGDTAEFHTVAPPGPDEPVAPKIPLIKEESGDDFVEQTESQYGRTHYSEYDDKDRLTKQYAIHADGSKGNTFFFFYDEDWNMVKDSLSKPDGYWNVYRTEYYTDIPNTLSAKNFGKKYLGEQNKHCRKRRVMTSSIGEVHINDYVRPLQDEEGRVTEIRVISTNVCHNTSVTYYYNYKYY